MAEIEQILSNLLVPDNDVIKRATEELKNAFKRDDAIPQLCTVMSTSAVVQVTLPQAISDQKLYFVAYGNHLNTKHLNMGFI